MFMRSGYSAHTRSVRSGSGTKHHHRAPDVLLGGGDLHPAGRAQARGLALALEQVWIHAVEADEVALDAQLTVGGHGLASALKGEGVAFSAHGDRPAAVDDAVALGDIGERPRKGAVADVKEFEVVGDGDR